jgi:hypothetical protein
MASYSLSLHNARDTAARAQANDSCLGPGGNTLLGTVAPRPPAWQPEPAAGLLRPKPAENQHNRRPRVNDSSLGPGENVLGIPAAAAPTLPPAAYSSSRASLTFPGAQVDWLAARPGLSRGAGPRSDGHICCAGAWPTVATRQAQGRRDGMLL